MVVAILIANGHCSLTASDLRIIGHYRGDNKSQPLHHVRTPKALLNFHPSARHGCLLDPWWDLVRSSEAVSKTYLVVNAAFFKHFERWATANGFPTECIINDGTTDAASALTPGAALSLVTRRVGAPSEPVLLVAAEAAASILWLRSLDTLDQGARNYVWWPGGHHSMPGAPQHEVMDGIPMLHLPPSTVKLLDADMHAESLVGLDLIALHLKNVHGLKIDAFTNGYRSDVALFPHGGTHPANTNESLLRMYKAYNKIPPHQPEPQSSASSEEPGLSQQPLICKAHARVGVMGNPSDGFFGRTISLSIGNFWAEVRLWPSDTLRILPHPLYDPMEFGNLADVAAIVKHEGTNGGVRLLLACCKRFHEFAKDKAIDLRTDSQFTLAYDTNVPRQVGLAGSSAIITATVRALMGFYRITEAQLPLDDLPSLVLSIEKEELGINAGLQDRVIQAYGGLVFMDFERSHQEATGRGKYERIPMELSPPLWLAYLADPSDSGKAHSTVKARFEAGDAAVIAGMQKFGQMTSDAKEAILHGDLKRLGELMAANFALRRELYGDGAIGAANLRMVEIAQKHNVPCKFPGSGGAVVGLVVDVESMTAMQHELERNGCVFTRLVASPPI